jgi:hypothetical protein
VRSRAACSPVESVKMRMIEQYAQSAHRIGAWGP